MRIKEELSYGAILKRLRVSKSTLSYWLREYPLSEDKILELRRRGWKKGEASRERFRATMRKKREEKMRTLYGIQQERLKHLSADTFFVAGLMLYLGEGSKKNPYDISLANTDSRIIVFFVKWLEEFLDTRKSSLKFGLHLYENMDLAKEKKFWQNVLGVPLAQFYKPQVRKLQKSSFSYKESFRHGTCDVRFYNAEKKCELMAAIQAFLDAYMKK